MKLIEEIKKEHDQVKDLFLAMENEEEKAPSIFKELAVMLLCHHEAEEHVVFEELSRKKDTLELKKNLIAEHEALRGAIQAVLSTPEEDKMWEARVHVLKDLCSHHMEEEEGEGFKIFREEFEEKEQNKLTAEFEKYYKSIESDMKKKVADKYVQGEEDILKAKR